MYRKATRNARFFRIPGLNISTGCLSDDSGKHSAIISIQSEYSTTSTVELRRKLGENFGIVISSEYLREIGPANPPYRVGDARGR